MSIPPWARKRARSEALACWPTVALIEPGLFGRITFEKLLHIPLVPFVQAGITGAADIAYVDNLTEVVGFIGGKVGGPLTQAMRRKLTCLVSERITWIGATGGSTVCRG